MRQTVKGSTEGLLGHQGESFSKIARKAEGGLAPGRGYLSHRGAAGERLMSSAREHADEDREKRKSIDSNTPGMDTNPDDDGVDWNEWERSESLRGRGGLGRSISREEDDYRVQKVDGWSRLG